MKRAKSLALVGACVLLSIAIYAKSDKKTDLPDLKVDTTPLKPEIKAATSLAPMIKKASPSVVSIYCETTTEIGNPFQNNPYLRRFLDPEMFEDEREQPRSRQSTGVGSGVIVSKDGYILTNAHVVENATKIEVQFADGKTTHEATVIGADPNSDVAVIKIDASNLSSIILGNSDHLEVGDAVLAIGNPMNVGHTVTRGIVSAVGRGGLGMVNYENFIQTDAPINSGNSGGALIDAQGRLVGINTMIVSRSGGNNGIGLSIPVNMARVVMARLIQYGKMVRGYLGVRLQPLNPEIADSLGLKNAEGALASDVQPNTPASKAGLKPGDVIIKFNDTTIKDMQKLRLTVSQTEPDTECSVTVLRDGKPRQFKLTLEPFPEEIRNASFEQFRNRGKAPAKEEALKGVEVSDLDREAREKHAIPAKISGALILSVEEGTTAHKAGLEAGDVIQQIQHTDVEGADHAVELTADIGRRRILLRVWKNAQQGSQFIVVDERKRGR
ncbi:Do family serine endopeptidase [Verrucomicrobia bacterium]|nr:Do family serine endopeptidase [Verrucomicrobiota bacterium]